MSIDEEARFEAQFRHFAGHVQAYALRRAGAEVAQDVTAETFLIAWRRRAQAPNELLPWLYGIARGVLANELRAANRRGALLGRIAGERQPSAGGIDDHDVLAAVARLSARDREALLLTAWEGLSVSEAAQAVGCSAATLSVRLHRARRRFARALADADPITEPPGQPHPVSEVSA